MVDTAGEFREMVIADKDEQYNKERLSLKEALNDPEGGLSEDYYESALKYIMIVTTLSCLISLLCIRIILK